MDTKAGAATMQRTLFCTRAIKSSNPVRIKPLHNRSSAPSHITQEKPSHAAVWTAHAATGDEREKAKGAADHREKLVLPTAHHHRRAVPSEQRRRASTAATQQRTKS